jgi:hypothetical protein
MTDNLYPILLRNRADLLKVLKTAEALHLVRFTKLGKRAVRENGK